MTEASARLPTITGQGLEVRLSRRATDTVSPDCFEVVEVDVAEPGPGQVVVRNLIMSVDPYMLSRLVPLRGAAPAFEVGRALDGDAVGVIVESADDTLARGQYVLHRAGFREWATLAASDVTVIDITDVSPSAYLGVLGMPGFTAWVAARLIAIFRAGESVLVTAGAGAVGTTYTQLARFADCRVVCSVGNDDNGRRLVDELGADAWFNYRDGPFTDLAIAALPEGADLALDNIGGAQLRDMIEVMRPQGRIVMCGSAALYGPNTPPISFEARQLIQLVSRRLTLRGFTYPDHLAAHRDFRAEMSELLSSGAIVNAETVVNGLDRAVEAMLGIFTGTPHFGKLIVDVS
ncbi:NADPH-dependent curcumin reductase CurA [Nocardia kruczakiae]|uniref:NADPH-dependent curcumin reductase CurA n=1 Tax=Nocardia kruczakiae TaxID=261477 RepID=A0ABU1X9Y1_9NOCA|nr:NADP-dependent oxidoreductase [Nocardia kruczakiae]MDR7167347.1 NADPH-dependent curcumin reductase CurA [Nocardia kruczakiae]